MPVTSPPRAAPAPESETACVSVLMSIYMTMEQKNSAKNSKQKFLVKILSFNDHPFISCRTDFAGKANESHGVPGVINRRCPPEYIAVRGTTTGTILTSADLLSQKYL